MPITGGKIVKTIQGRKIQKTTKKNKQRQKQAIRTEAIVKGWELNGFVGLF